jgi:hypothetical protein
MATRVHSSCFTSGRSQGQLPLPNERRGVFAEPFLLGGLRLKLSHLDAVDGRAVVSDLLDVGFRHFANPYDPVALEAAGGQVNGSVIQRFVEVAPPDQHEVHEVPGELQQQPFG